MAKKAKSPQAIPQTDDIWYCAVRKLGTFIRLDEEGDEYFRPSVILVMNLKTDMIQAVEIVREPISIQELNEKLQQVMVKPLRQFGVKAHRPAEIHFEDEALANALQPLLAQVQVTPRFAPQRENMDSIVQELEKSAFGGDAGDYPGLLKQPGIKPEQAGSLFSAALTFYQAAPWVQLSNDDILSIQVKGHQDTPYYVIVMGQGGEEYGLSVFRDWKEVETFFGAAHALEAIPSGGRHAFLFNEPPEISIDDLDAIDQYGWELPAPDLVPTPAIYFSDKIRRPDAAMLHWYEAALQAIPIFVSDYLETEPGGSHSPVEANLDVQTFAGKAAVQIRYPGGDLSALENRLMRRLDELEATQDEEDNLLISDRRGMERMLDQLTAELGDGSSNQDPALQKAQEIMYDAWDERNPARRISLAKKALQTSPNCADAYVLLAEEEAQTPQQALKYYQAGMDAGRRALGDDLLADPENIGHFWGILKTRPFMRAMEGLGTIQWELGQHEKAEQQYRELLRLNPGDNQGIRYLLLNMLIDMGRDEQALALLRDYEGDWSADMAYSAALLAFREKGDSPEAKQALERAFEVNQHVPNYLTGWKRIPPQQSDMITMGGEDEAAAYASAYLNHWRKTPGAVDWLRVQHKKRK